MYAEIMDDPKTMLPWPTGSVAGYNKLEHLKHYNNNDNNNNNNDRLTAFDPGQPG